MKRIITIFLFVLVVAIMATNAQTDSSKRKQKASASPAKSSKVTKSSKPAKSTKTKPASKKKKKRRAEEAAVAEELYILIDDQGSSEVTFDYTGGTSVHEFSSNFEGDLALYWCEEDDDDENTLHEIEEVEWCDFEQTEEDGFKITVSPNSGANSRYVYLVLDSDTWYCSVAVLKIIQKGNQVTGNIEKVWVDHNVTDSNGRKGMNIHVKFNINGMLNKTGQAAAYFYSEDGTPLKDQNNSYSTSSGNVATHVTFTPIYEKSTFNDLVIFMPYSELHLTKTTTCYFTISIWNGNTGNDMQVANSEKQNFQITF